MQAVPVVDRSERRQTTWSKKTLTTVPFVS